MNIIQLRTFVEALDAPIPLSVLMDIHGATMQTVGELCATGKVAAWMDKDEQGAIQCVIAPKRLTKGLTKGLRK